MNKGMKASAAALSLFLLGLPATTQARQWTLSDCINYALTNNISLKKTTLQRLSALEDVQESKAQLLPSLSASTSQTVTYNPFPLTGRATVTGDYIESSVKKVYYNGSYTVQGNWTVWNGNRNRNQVKLNQLVADKADLDSATQARSIQEQIAQLYVQILYSTEDVKVCQESYAMSAKNEERGKEMLKIGKMSQSDVAQLSAQAAQDKYNIVAAESAVKNYKRQLKQLLQITNDEAFDVIDPKTTDAEALQPVPKLSSIYEASLNNRPELKAYQNSIDQYALSYKIAKASNLPTVSLNAGVGTSTTSLSSNAWDNQIKNNFGINGGVTVSIPIFDQRSRKTSMNKAKISEESARLDLQNEQTTLYSTIENYWLQAVTNQDQYKAARVSTTSAETSYNLLSEQFKLGLKNISDLRTGKDNLIKARQSELQAKYLTILNLDMLDFYKNGTLKK